MNSFFTIFAQTAGFEVSVKALILNSGPVAKAVLALLFVFSIIGWTIIGAKWIMFSKALGESNRFLRLFRQHGSMGKIVSRVGTLRGTPLLRMLRASYEEMQALTAAGQDKSSDDLLRKPSEESSKTMSLKSEQLKFVATVLERVVTEEIVRFEKALPFLATAGSTAPFIGLFGTVWGVMQAFQGIGTAQSTSIGAVAPGISEALIATAAGLVAAIPAVMAYNHFIQKLRQLTKILNSFTAELLDYIEKRYCAS